MDVCKLFKSLKDGDGLPETERSATSTLDLEH